MAQRRKVRTELTEEQMQEIREVFETFDSDGSGVSATRQVLLLSCSPPSPGHRRQRDEIRYEHSHARGQELARRRVTSLAPLGAILMHLHVQIEQIMDKLDSSGNKEIEFSEFLAFMRPKILEQDNSKMIEEQFENYADSCLEHRNAEECNHQPEDCKKGSTRLHVSSSNSAQQSSRGLV